MLLIVTISDNELAPSHPTTMSYRCIGDLVFFPNSTPTWPNIITVGHNWVRLCVERKELIQGRMRESTVNRNTNGAMRIPWLLMPWLFAYLGHKQSGYWPQDKQVLSIHQEEFQLPAPSQYQGIMDNANIYSFFFFSNNATMLTG